MNLANSCRYAQQGWLTVNMQVKTLQGLSEKFTS